MAGKRHCLYADADSPEAYQILKTKWKYEWTINDEFTGREKLRMRRISGIIHFGSLFVISGLSNKIENTFP